MKISVSGNTKYYQDTTKPKQVEIVTYSLGTNDNINDPNRTFIFKKNDQLISILQPQKLLGLIEKLKGCDFSQVSQILNQYTNTPINSNYSYPEIGLIKALFSLYDWLQYSFNEPSQEEIEKYLFDELVIDYLPNHLHKMIYTFCQSTLHFSF